MTSAPANAPDVEPELVGLLDRLFERSGFDLRGYARPPLRRRLAAWLADHDPQAGIAGIDSRLGDDAAVARLLAAMTRHDTPIFGDPDGDRALRAQVVPFLRTYPAINVWLPACSNGGQAYATALVLHEVGLAGRAHVYATDLSEAALGRARCGVYSMSSMHAADAGYQLGGGRGTLGDYYEETGDDEVTVRPVLREHVTFLQHDLVTGASFNEFHLIRCRDILSAFGETLQERIFGLFHDSLARFGVLALGQQHARLRPPAPGFEVLDPQARLYRRAR